ncbi:MULTISPECIES: hypothetical protein [unclassified Actinomyces]|uniref:hypothetical protein n=1 Tax=unclassified Actinomyces TaxID=2609248 RepID=UPI002016AEFA|nr:MULTISPECIES: hypothetical protein [unclassified Actinomyces]MCL3777298.1 hypothetical protein [Actinomyces sp. AC-20-1]MCL3789569.1 hypothetical protein [Actinomyces sp. 187325]MCL3791854.1 hypothetical protein [Actinomyces sp. 186855]MCL3793660.1 hypothetical protein [Actinomyces sp. 217892]
MNSLHLGAARTGLEQAVALVPALVPDTWTGGASEACQRELDEARALLVAVGPLLDEAAGAVAAVSCADPLACWGAP